ncbi:MAG: ImmA/IrrE family metallo-endopeptidase [Erysipelotrichaceae bacterium]|nr:ImmA/IrrE family metallo-endopeptidase [Erysipelotrichaceae bacterium]
MKDLKIQEMMKMLECTVNSITSSEEYLRHLKVMARFPSYSARNTLLIVSQCPHATLVAGFSTWKKDFKRYVKKGEKAIRIFAPYTYVQKTVSNDGTVTETVRQSFRPVNVFDISQTDGKPMPEPSLPILLEGDLSQFESIVEGLQACTDYEICFVPLDQANGLCRHSSRQILIEESLGQMQAIKTLCHETAHSLLHDPSLAYNQTEQNIVCSSELKEIEAESTAFIVCTWLGLDASRFSFPYIAGWKQTSDFLEESLQRISRASYQMIETLKCFLERETENRLPEAGDQILRLPA